MKRFLLALAIACTGTLLHGQNRINYYEYWFDANTAGKVTTSITPVAFFNLNTSIPTAGLSQGLHTVNVRFRDENGAYSAVVSNFFLKNAATASVPNMASCEYWFDNGYASRVTTVLPANQQVNFSQLVATPALSAGLHTIHIRFKDSSGKWSSVLSQFFLKPAVNSGSGTPALTDYQYWYDNDFANAQQTALSGSAFEQVAALLDASTLQNGLHTLHVRFRDANDTWSSVVSQFFLKESTTSVVASLTDCQYWFDSDFGNAQMIALSGNPYEQLSSAINAAALTEGVHTLHVRFLDSQEQWSSVLSSFFVKSATAAAPEDVVAYRYWFDMNEAQMVTVNIPAPAQWVNANDPVSMVQVPKGAHTVHFQFRDAVGVWSSVTNDTIYKNSLPIAAFSADTTHFCDGGTVTFDNTSIDGEEFLWDFGDGNTSTDSLPVHTYATPGLYTVSLTATDPAVSLDSTTTISQLIQVYETPDATVVLNGNDSICAGSSVDLSVNGTGSYLWSDGSSGAMLTVTQSGDYSVIVQNTDYPVCADSSDTVTIVQMPLPDADFTYDNNGQDLVVTFTNVSPEADAFLWNYGDGNQSTQTEDPHVYSANGLYDIYLVAYNFCGTDTAFATVDLRYISLNETVSTQSVRLYPNPTQAQTYIDVDGWDQASLTVAVLNEAGQEVQLNRYTTAVKTVELDLSLLENGVYYVRITNAVGWTATQKVVVNH